LTGDAFPTTPTSQSEGILTTEDAVRTEEMRKTAGRVRTGGGESVRMPLRREESPWTEEPEWRGGRRFCDPFIQMQQLKKRAVTALFFLSDQGRLEKAPAAWARMFCHRRRPNSPESR
jgi:hypothetical protein